MAQFEVFGRFSAEAPTMLLAGASAPGGEKTPQLLAFVVPGLQKYDSNRFRSEERSMNSKKWPSIFSTEADEAALTVGTIFLRSTVSQMERWRSFQNGSHGTRATWQQMRQRPKLKKSVQ